MRFSQKISTCWSRSNDLWVMSPTRFLCAKVLRQNDASRRHTQMRMTTQHTPPNDSNNEHPHTTRRSRNALHISNTTTIHAYGPRAPHPRPASHHAPQTMMDARLHRRHLVPTLLTHVLVPACACSPTTAYCKLQIGETCAKCFFRARGQFWDLLL